MIDEALAGNVTVHQSTNALRSPRHSPPVSNTEWITLSDLRVNFDRNMNAKDGVYTDQYGVCGTQFRTSPDGHSINIFVVLGQRALDPGRPFAHADDPEP